ncbi:hypothetical protein [Actinomadura flavalba]|uniref:hypothetical protein n=1 Tax=Actinomadura flavalba TaxID=1120938 RepID=UPI00035FB990|nr:hypothetical protein [Actinomadura flavalba]
MFTERKRRKREQKVKDGDGRPLKPFRGRQQLSRALFHLDLRAADGSPARYSVDVPYWQRFVTSDGHGKAHLYLNGRHHAESTLPATFPVPGGVIDVLPTPFGLKRCHYLTEDGTERQLVPDPRSAEGRRARLSRERPALSRFIGVLSVLLLLVPLALIIPQIVEPLSRIPPVAERVGTFTSPFDVPGWLNAVLALLASMGGVERATRLRFNAFLDGAN